jgi:hypothetical protein
MHQRTIRKQVISWENNFSHDANTKTQIFPLILHWNKFLEESEKMWDLDWFNTRNVLCP